MQLNVLVDALGNARLLDFGHIRIARNVDLPGSADGHRGLDVRWIAPEVLRFDSLVTKESDIFSFGMVIIEARCDQSVVRQPTYPLPKVFTGEIPFSEETSMMAAVRIVNGERPKRPNHSGFTEALWALTQRCWSQEPHDRPNILEVTGVLKGL